MSHSVLLQLSLEFTDFWQSHHWRYIHTLNRVCIRTCETCRSRNIPSQQQEGLILVIGYRLLFMCFFNFVRTDLFELLSMHPSFTNGTFGLSNGAFGLSCCSLTCLKNVNCWMAHNLLHLDSWNCSIWLTTKPSPDYFTITDKGPPFSTFIDSKSCSFPILKEYAD